MKSFTDSVLPLTPKENGGFLPISHFGAKWIGVTSEFGEQLGGIEISLPLFLAKSGQKARDVAFLLECECLGIVFCFIH